MTDAEKLGRQIERARTALGWSQKDLAEKLGPGGKERTIQSWEAGERRPRGRTLIRVRMLLGIEGDAAEAESEWPTRVQRVINVLGDQLTTLPPEEVKRWRHEFIVGLMADRYERRRDWPDDVTVIAEIIGARLADDEGSDRTTSPDPSGLSVVPDRSDE